MGGWACVMCRTNRDILDARNARYLLPHPLILFMRHMLTPSTHLLDGEPQLTRYQRVRVLELHLQHASQQFLETSHQTRHNDKVKQKETRQVSEL